MHRERYEALLNWTPSPAGGSWHTRFGLHQGRMWSAEARWKPDWWSGHSAQKSAKNDTDQRVWGSGWFQGQQIVFLTLTPRNPYMDVHTATPCLLMQRDEHELDCCSLLCRNPASPSYCGILYAATAIPAAISTSVEIPTFRYGYQAESYWAHLLSYISYAALLSRIRLLCVSSCNASMSQAWANTWIQDLATASKLGPELGS